jgi:carboxyl-terminal processing protease
MKAFYRKTTAIILSICLFALIFGAGFFLGNTKQNFFGNGVRAEEPLNLSPFWKAYNILEEKFVNVKEEEITEEKKVFGAISGLVDSYGDPYTTFLPPTQNEDFEETISGVFVGVGMEVGIRDGFITVISPLKDSPAERAGIKSEDKLIAINGESAIDMTVDDAVDKIRGEKGTTVALTLIRTGEKDPITIEVVRDTIIIPTIDTETIGNVFVISLYNFSATAPSEFRNALREFVKTKKSRLILDLRGNPGGFLESSISVASWFLPLGKVIAIEDFGEGGEQKEFMSKGYDIFNDNLKMAILIDGGSASASEIVAGALREHGVATLVGKNTFGKGSVQELVDITDTTSLKVTIARWLTPEGKSISDGGLAPDNEVEFDSEKFEEGIDVQLQKAIEVLQ